MFERRLLFSALLFSLSASSLDAQQALADVQARREHLSARAESLRVVVGQLRAAEQDSGVVVDVRSGVLHMRTTDGLAPTAHEALAQAQKAAVNVLGPDAATIAQRLSLTLRENRSRVQWRIGLPLLSVGGSDVTERMTSASLSASLDGRELPGVTLYPPVTTNELADAVLAALEQASASTLPAVLSAWTGTRLSLREQAPDDWQNAYRAMATADAAVVRRCVAGDRGACRLAFALDSVPANRLAAWYDVSDLPGVARSAGDPMQRSTLMSAVSAEERDECTERHNLELCRRMLAYLPSEAFSIPLSMFHRGTLVGLALRIGGAQALPRLGAASGSIGERLSAAAGVSSDSLVALWQRRVMAARPSSPLPSVSFVFASLACIAVCVTLAARGRPWR